MHRSGLLLNSQVVRTIRRKRLKKGGNHLAIPTPVARSKNEPYHKPALYYYIGLKQRRAGLCLAASIAEGIRLFTKPSQ
jgi:hypothetical protein